MRIEVVFADSDWLKPSLQPGELFVSVKDWRGDEVTSLTTLACPEGLDEAFAFARKIIERELANPTDDEQEDLPFEPQGEAA